MFGSSGFTLKVMSLFSWQRNDSISFVNVMLVNQPAPRFSSTVINPPPVFTGAVVGTCTAGAGCVASTTTVTTTAGGLAGTAVGGSAVGEGTSVGAWVASTTTVCTITTGVGEASMTVGAGGSVAAGGVALLHAAKMTASKRITNFFI